MYSFNLKTAFSYKVAMTDSGPVKAKSDPRFHHTISSLEKLVISRASRQDQKEFNNLRPRPLLKRSERSLAAKVPRCHGPADTENGPTVPRCRGEVECVARELRENHKRFNHTLSARSSLVHGGREVEGGFCYKSLSVIKSHVRHSTRG
jgi:hypothetical protein